MATILARILQSTGLAANVGSILAREFGVSSDEERPAIGTTVGGTKFLATEETVNITSMTPAALTIRRRSNTLIFVDTATAGGNVALDIQAGAQIAGYRCRVFVNGPDTRQAIVNYGSGLIEYIPNGLSQEFVWSGAAWMKTALSNADRYLIGSIIDSAFDDTADAKNPIIKLWDADHDITQASAPLLYTKLYNQKGVVWNGAAYVDSHTVTIAGSVATGSGTAWTNLLAAFAEDELVHGSYVNWRSANVAGTEYQIANVNTVAGTMTFGSAPPSGSQTLIYYPNRIAGLATSIRLFKDSGRALMSINGVTLCPGLRRRNHLQGHWHIIRSAVGSGTNYYPSAGSGSSTTDYSTSVRDPITDGTHGTPRIASDTESDSTPIYRVIWAGVLL